MKCLLMRSLVETLKLDAEAPKLKEYSVVNIIENEFTKYFEVPITVVLQ